MGYHFKVGTSFFSATQCSKLKIENGKIDTKQQSRKTREKVSKSYEKRNLIYWNQ